MTPDQDTLSFLASVKRDGEALTYHIECNVKLDRIDTNARRKYVEASRQAMADLLAACGVVERRK